MWKIAFTENCTSNPYFTRVVPHRLNYNVVEIECIRDPEVSFSHCIPSFGGVHHVCIPTFKSVSHVCPTQPSTLRWIIGRLILDCARFEKCDLGFGLELCFFWTSLQSKNVMLHQSTSG